MNRKISFLNLKYFFKKNMTMSRFVIEITGNLESDVVLF